MTRVAGIDCGTNSVRLLVADLPDGVADGRSAAAELTDVVRRMEIVRLGQGVDRTGRLAAEAIERTRVALAGYAELIAESCVDRVRMVATSATRDADNADEFRSMVRGTLGVDPEVVSGDEEARLSFSGAVRGLGSELRGPYLVVDIGGGSTEFVLGRVNVGGADLDGAERGSAELGRAGLGRAGLGRAELAGGLSVDSAISVDIGCVRLTERHLKADPPTAEQIEAATADIASTVDRALAVVPGAGAGTLIGLAGSVTTVAALALGLDTYRPERIHHARISLEQVEAITADLLARTVAQRLELPVMHPGRADVIGAGALILAVLMRRAGAGSVVASERDILDGICYSLE